MFADRNESLRGTVTYSSLRRVLDHIEESRWPADLIALTGDLVQDDSSAAYDHIVTLMEPLGLPILTVPGNHDIRALMQAALHEPVFHYCGSLVRDRWLIVGLDSCVTGSAGGRVADSELVRLHNEIAATGAEHVAIFLHHPPLPVGSRWLDSVGMENGPEFLHAIGESGKVRAALFGHVHQRFEGSHASVKIIGTPSTCRQFKIGSDEFALDEHPPAYRRIELHSDGAVESELIWVADSSRFETIL